MSKTLEELDAEFEAAVEADDNERAEQLLEQIESLKSAGSEADDSVITLTPPPPAEAETAVSAEAIGLEQTVAKEVTQMSESPVSITKDQLGAGGFEPVLAQLSSEQIEAMKVKVSGTEDLMALVLPGVSQIDAENREHLEQRGDVSRAARGLALAAAGGVQLESGVILSNSGRTYTIEQGLCYELKRTEQLDFSSNVSIIEKKVPCNGHLEYNKTETGFKPTGGSHLRCLHQWALMFALGHFVTASEKVYSTKVSTEIAQRVGDEAARKVAQAQIDEWVANSAQRRDTRQVYAQAINHERNVGNTNESGRLPARREIAQYNLPDGSTVAQAVSSLEGKFFTLTIELPINGKMSQVTTRVVRNIAELADAIAPSFAVAARENAELNVVSVNAR